jgi:hypothetical protein
MDRLTCHGRVWVGQVRNSFSHIRELGVTKIVSLVSICCDAGPQVLYHNGDQVRWLELLPDLAMHITAILE